MSKLYSTIHNTPITIKSFNLNHIFFDQENPAPPSLQISLDESTNIETLHHAWKNAYRDIIDGLIFYSDPEMTEVVWSTDHKFTIHHLSEQFNNAECDEGLVIIKDLALDLVPEAENDDDDDAE